MTTTQLESLTGREEDVLRLMTAGQTNGEIASELVVSIETVRWYTKQIYGKLGVHSRTQAVLRSRELGLFKGKRKGSAESKKTVRQPRPTIKLPFYTTTFIGREQSLKELSELIAHPDVRLVTIAGPGGIGKTRFCVELARQISKAFPEGVYFISLAPLNSLEEATAEIGRQLGLHFTNNKNDQQLAAYLQEKRLLLVLDNLEHLPDGPAWVSSLLAATNHLKLLVSSQRSLNISAEYVRYLDGVSYPDQSVPNPEDFAAIKLFTERARRVRHDFNIEQNLDCMAEICRRLHGLPLALELAAAWVKSLSCTEIAAELKDKPDFLTTRHTDVEDRHHSLQAVFDYAWKLLENSEMRVLLRLSPFRGGFSRTTAEAVAGADVTVLARLVDKSFLVQSGTGNFMFHELLRQYAADLLEQLSSANLTTRSGKLLLWSLFIKGEFERAEQLATDILARSVPGSTEQAFGLALTGLLAGMEEDYDTCLEMSKVADSLTGKAADDEDSLTQLFVHLGLAVAACGFGEYDQIQEQTALALNQANKMESPAFLLLCLPLTAVLLAHNAESEEAVQLLSLTFNHPAHTSAWLEKWPLLTQLQSDMTAELGPDLYNDLWEQGKKLNLETSFTGLLSLLQAAD